MKQVTAGQIGATVVRLGHGVSLGEDLQFMDQMKIIFVHGRSSYFVRDQTLEAKFVGPFATEHATGELLTVLNTSQNMQQENY